MDTNKPSENELTESVENDLCSTLTRDLTLKQRRIARVFALNHGYNSFSKWIADTLLVASGQEVDE